MVLNVWSAGCGGGAAQTGTSDIDEAEDEAPVEAGDEAVDEAGDGKGDGDGDAEDGGEPGDGDPDEGDPGAPSGPKFDTKSVPDGNAGSCGEGSGDVEFSYIWIANSDQGTLSKIDTETLVEVARYQIRPDGGGMPSRTSVNLSGDVAVASREGGVTKVYARLADCEEQNGSPGLQTSSGANDILAWGEEECIAWHAPMEFDSQRPIAWTQGSFNEGDCTWSDQKVWTTGTSGAGGYAEVIRLDGDDGSVDGMVHIPDLTPFNSFGGYGAVVDAEGNLWFNEMFVVGDNLVRVDADDLAYELIPSPGRTGYGIAIDEDGRIWTCGNGLVSRYDPDTDDWVDAPNLLAYGGCMVDAEGRLWVSNSDIAPYSIRAYDVETLGLLLSHEMPEHLHGISIDFAGYVWGVGGAPGIGGGERALRIEPETGTYETVEGLSGAYTYSDMTGFALASSVQG
ncbi:hypothetical protein ENSA5_65230 [Enhygromyxa salina]|uniref:Virginiamycin B lyase n=1 Tax=Enhygromyxa salina TaxID=215803 RepID=A0A2S9XCM3_9BACT|nr:hypothetical protein [Enhygromyxa salina]PRP90431.1 hypothetical protein ENSA5_65230 [Enhygromyxa salina]